VLLISFDVTAINLPQCLLNIRRNVVSLKLDIEPSLTPQMLEPGSSTTSLQFCMIFTGFQSGSVSVSNCLWWFTSAYMVWHRPTWLTYALLSRPSSAGGSCGRRTAGHSLCQVQGPPSVGVTSRCPGQRHGTDFRLNCGLLCFPLTHSQRSSKLICLAASISEDFCLLGAIQMDILIDCMTWSVCPCWGQTFWTHAVN